MGGGDATRLRKRKGEAGQRSARAAFRPDSSGRITLTPSRRAPLPTRAAGVSEGRGWGASQD